MIFLNEILELTELKFLEILLKEILKAHPKIIQLLYV